MTSSYPPPPYPGSPVPAGGGAPKRRPSVAWFVVGGALLLVALLVFCIAAVVTGRVIHRAIAGRAELSGPGIHRLTLDPGVRRAVFVRGRLRCGAVDGTGTPVRFARPEDHTTFGDWRLVATFNTGDGHLTLRCTQHGVASILALPDRHTVVSLLVLGLLAPMLLGLLGFLVLLVTTILWVARRPPTAPLPSRAPPPSPV